MTTPPANPQTTPATDDKKKRSKWTGLEAEILELIVRPKMMAAITHLNKTEGVSAASVARFFNEHFKVPASDNTIAAWFKDLGIKVTTRAYVAIDTNPTQSVLNEQLNAMLARQAAANRLPESPLNNPLAGGVDPTGADNTPMTFMGAQPVINASMPDPQYGGSLSPTPPDNHQ